MHYYKRNLGDYAKTLAKARNWLSIDLLEEKLHLPMLACCYVIYFNGALKYIGSTSNLRNRFSGHSIRYGYGKNLITPWGDFDLPIRLIVKYRPSNKYGDWLMQECRLIRRLQPVFNKRLKGRAV